jgi:chromate transporter
MHDLPALAGLFAQLSLLAVGGILSVLPEMQRQVVEVHHWMTADQFAALFALAQAAPGPNMLVSTLIGWRVAGLAGALTATLSLIGPPCLLTFATASTWHRFREARWRRQAQAGLTPVSVGLIMAGAVLLCGATAHGPGSVLLTLGTAMVLLLTDLHPLWTLAAGAALGAAGLI